MGLFDTIMGAIQNGGSGDNNLIGLIGNLINQQGGLTGLVAQFQQAGLGEQVQSWVSSGANLPISAEQIQAVLGQEQLAGLASQLGVDPAQAASQLSEQLPGLVDQLTPGGELPEGGLADITQQLGGLGKLFG